MGTLDDLKKEREELGNQDVTGKTLDQVMAMANRARALDMRIADLERAPKHTQRDRRALRMPQAARGTAGLPIWQPRGKDTPVEKRQYRGLSELNLGKYAMTVLAAGLCLLALAILLAGFWAELMGGIKFALILAAGCGMMGLGIWRLTKTDRLRPFWLGVSGLGSGVIFLDAMAGLFIWELYGLGVLGCMLVMWMAFGFVLGYTKSAGVFYAIAYLGGAITVWLAGEVLVPGIQSEAIVGILILSIAVMGRVVFWKTRAQYLIVANIVFSMILSGMAVDSMHWHSIAPLWEAALYEQVLLPWVILALALAVLWDIRNIVFKLPPKTNIILQAVAAFFAACFLNWSSELAFAVHYAPIIAAFGLGLMVFRARKGYILGVSVPAFWILTEIWPVYGSLIPACVATALIAMPKTLDRKCDRAGVVCLYALTAWHAIWDRPDDMVPATLITMAVLLAGIALYWFIVQRDNLWTNKSLELLAMACVPGSLLQMLYCFDGFPRCLPDCIVSLSLLAYGTYWLDKQEREGSGLARFLWYGLRAVVYGMIMLHSVLAFFNISAKVIITGYAVFTAAWHIWNLVKPGRKRWAPVISCLLSNWHMWALFSIWDDMDHAILISLLGLVLAVGFIWLGFKLEVTSARHMGLACAILYSIKLALFDVGLFDTIGSVGGLLLAGLICFGISLVYNKQGGASSKNDSRP